MWAQYGGIEVTLRFHEMLEIAGGISACRSSHPLFFLNSRSKKKNRKIENSRVWEAGCRQLHYGNMWMSSVLPWEKIRAACGARSLL
jgi:hypothetical protein